MKENTEKYVLLCQRRLQVLFHDGLQLSYLQLLYFRHKSTLKFWWSGIDMVLHMVPHMVLHNMVPHMALHMVLLMVLHMVQYILLHIALHIVLHMVPHMAPYMVLHMALHMEIIRTSPFSRQTYWKHCPSQCRGYFTPVTCSYPSTRGHVCIDWQGLDQSEQMFIWLLWYQPSSLSPPPPHQSPKGKKTYCFCWAASFQ